MCRIRHFVGLAAAALLLGTASLAQAQSVLECFSGQLGRRGNWSPNVVPTGSSGPAIIDNGGTATIDATTGPLTENSISVSDGNGPGAVNMVAGTISSVGGLTSRWAATATPGALHPIRRTQLFLCCLQPERLQPAPTWPL